MVLNLLGVCVLSGLFVFTIIGVYYEKTSPLQQAVIIGRDVLELQQTKRDVADAIIGAENSVLRGLTREHLELLLS
jgi:hypothetical protein